MIEFLKRLAVVWLLGFFAVSVHSKAADLEVASTHWKPFIFEDERVIKGPMYDFATAILHEAGISYQYDLYMWARVYKLGLTKDNFMIVGIGRIPRRESQFRWIGPVTNRVGLNLYKSKGSKIVINNLDQAKSYIVGTIRNAYFHELLQDSGFNSDSVVLVSTTEQLVQLLDKGRIDLILIDNQHLMTTAKNLNLNSSHFVKAYRAFNGAEYIAMSKTSDEALVRKVQMAYDSLLAKGKIQLLDITKPPVP